MKQLHTVFESRTKLETSQMEVGFKDFSQPSVKKTGYLIPLQSGHNGDWSLAEKTLLEVHLVNAGMVEAEAN